MLRVCCVLFFGCENIFRFCDNCGVFASGRGEKNVMCTTVRSLKTTSHNICEKKQTIYLHTSTSSGEWWMNRDFTLKFRRKIEKSVKWTELAAETSLASFSGEWYCAGVSSMCAVMHACECPFLCVCVSYPNLHCEVAMHANQRKKNNEIKNGNIRLHPNDQMLVYRSLIGQGDDVTWLYVVRAQSDCTRTHCEFRICAFDFVVREAIAVYAIFHVASVLASVTRPPRFHAHISRVISSHQFARTFHLIRSQSPDFFPFVSVSNFVARTHQQQTNTHCDASGADWQRQPNNIIESLNENWLKRRKELQWTPTSNLKTKEEERKKQKEREKSECQINAPAVRIAYVRSFSVAACQNVCTERQQTS